MLYVIYGGILLYPRQIFEWWTRSKDEQSGEQHKQYKFMIMAGLDALGMFFSAMGSVHTPGYLQTILNQTLIPLTMVVSFVVLGSRFSGFQIFGCCCIILGALVSCWDQLFPPPPLDEDIIRNLSAPPETFYKLSIFFYLISNLPYAMSAVYKEVAFKSKAKKTDVLYLTQQVSIYQLVFGILMLPLTVIPGVATPSGMSLTDALLALKSGFSCYLQSDPTCAVQNTFLLLTGYCALNFISNTLGLTLTKYGSSTVNAISGSLLLPLTTIAFTMPWLGSFREEVHPQAIYGLLLILSGFFIYQYDGSEAAQEEIKKINKKKWPNSPMLRRIRAGTEGADVDDDEINTFQERLVGIKIRHGLGKGKKEFQGCLGLGHHYLQPSPFPSPAINIGWGNGAGGSGEKQKLIDVERRDYSSQGFSL